MRTKVIAILTVLIFVTGSHLDALAYEFANRNGVGVFPVYNMTIVHLERAVLDSLPKLEDVDYSSVKQVVWQEAWAKDKIYGNEMEKNYNIRTLSLKWVPKKEKLLILNKRHPENTWCNGEPRESTIRITVGAHKNGNGGTFLSMGREWRINNYLVLPKTAIPIWPLRGTFSTWALLNTDIEFMKSLDCGSGHCLIEAVRVNSKEVLNYMKTLSPKY